MTVITGDLILVTDRPAMVTEVWIRAGEIRTHDGGLVLEDRDREPIHDGWLEINVLPGPAILTLVSHGTVRKAIPIVVPDAEATSLEDAVNAAKLAQPSLKAWLEELAAAVLAGTKGPKGDRGPEGKKGPAGPAPYIQGGTWWTGGVDTGIDATGPQGDPGITPHIQGETWWVGDTDTGIRAQGPKGDPGDKGDPGPTGTLDLIDESVQTTIDTVAIPAIEGARDEALGQVEDALGRVEDAVGGAIADHLNMKADKEEVDHIENRLRSVEPVKSRPVPGTSWAHTTPDGHRLPLGYTEDGHLDDHARTVWREEISHTREVPVDFDTAHAVTTDDGHLLLSIQRDGTVEIPSLATSTLGAPQTFPTQDNYHHVLTTQDGHIIVGVGTDGSVTIPGLTLAEQAPPQMVASEMYWHPDGALAPAQARRDLIVGWGASGLEGMLPELADELADLPVTYVNHAKGGESVQHHAMRMGSRPALIEPVTIPATGPVNVRASNTLPSNQMRAFTGWLAGIHGTMSVTTNQLIFTRTTAGDPVEITSDTPFLPDIDPIYRDATAIFLPGENNLPRAEVELVKEVTAGMLKYLRPLMPRILVMGLKGNLDFTVGDVRWDRMHQINDFLIKLVGQDHYIDRQAILTGPEIWELTGLTPTAEDLDYQAAGKMPPSVAADTLHLNNIGDAAIAKVVRTRMHTLGWY